jgi:hypothetical protein
MSWIVAQMKWILLLSGALTFSMIYAFVAPQASLQSTFGDTLQGPLSDIVVRNWGALIALVGGMLIYAAFNPPIRPFVLTVAGASKLVFIGLVLKYGEQYLGQQVGVALGIDAVMVLLFTLYLIAVRPQ